MPEVAICTENVVIPTLGAGILCQGKRLEYPLKYFVQHHSVCSLVLIQPLPRNNAVLDWTWLESDPYDAVH
jgi:hypothetical protein